MAELLDRGALREMRRDGSRVDVHPNVNKPRTRRINRTKGGGRMSAARAGALYRYLALIACLGLASGCATPQIMTKMPIPSRIGEGPKSVPRTPSGVEKQVNVGDVMYASPITVKPVPAFKATVDYQPPSVGFTSFPPIRAGSELICPYMTGGQQDVFNPDTVVCQSKFAFLGQPKNGNTPVYGEYMIIVSKDGKRAGYMTGGIGGFWPDVPPGLFAPQEPYLYPISLKDELKQELVYNGKAGNTIKVSYREFSGNMARAAFTQDLVYDLSESKEISFRNIKIEVAEATNSYIRYKVVSQ